MFVSDQETEIDMLYYSSIAKTIIKLIKESSDAPVTIGIHGDWGAGKSSILMMIESAIQLEENILFIRFNGWQFQGFEDAKVALIETIITELRDYKNENDTLVTKAKDLLKRVDYLKLAKKGAGLAFTFSTGLPAPDQIQDGLGLIKTILENIKKGVSTESINDSVEEAEKFIKPKEENIPDEMRAFQKSFSELIDMSGLTKLVVIIDDLDRCLPSTAIETLEAIRLFLFAPKTVFIIAADEAMIEYSVKQHFPDLPIGNGPVTYARNYLEKLIQIPFRIPALGYVETQIYITLSLLQANNKSDNDNFEKLLEKSRKILCKPWENTLLDHRVAKDCLNTEELPEDVEQSITLSLQISSILTEGTKGNPRQIKRFLNSLILKSQIAEERGLGDLIKRPFLAKILLAETYSQSFYDQLTTIINNSMDGKPKEIALLESLEQIIAVKQTETKGHLEGGRTSQSDIVASWLENQWINSWAKIKPPLNNVDLRPYIFITRDKRAFYRGLSGANRLDAFAEKLTAGGMATYSVEADIKVLSTTDIALILDKLESNIMQKDDFKNKPEGMLLVVKLFPVFQKRLLDFYKRMPSEKIGVWVVTGHENIFVDPMIKAEYETLLQKLATQNKKIEVAIKAFSKKAK